MRARVLELGPGARFHLGLILVAASVLAAGIGSGAAGRLLAAHDARAGAVLTGVCLLWAGLGMALLWSAKRKLGRSAGAPSVAPAHQACLEQFRDIERAVSGAGHDLNNALTVVLGHVELLRVGGGASREVLDEVRHAALSARDIVLRLRESVSLPPGIDGTGRDSALSLSGGARVGVPPSPARPDDGPAPGGRRGRPSVLLVDDDPVITDVLAELLRQAGHEVHVERTGIGAIERYRRRRFDCVITDMTMPDLSGLMVSRAIKDHDAAARVLLLTGRPDDLDRPCIDAAGVDHVVGKPASLDDLVGLIETRPASRSSASREALCRPS